MRPADAFHIAGVFAALVAHSSRAAKKRRRPRAESVNEPGDRYTDSRGRRYWVDNRGTVRRVREEAANG